MMLYYNQEKVRGCFTLEKSPNCCDILLLQILIDQMKTVFLFNQIWKIRNSRLFHLSEDHQSWVNLHNSGILWHTPYNYEQALIIQPNQCRELSIISIVSFIHSVHKELPQVFIDPIGFIVEIISRDIILRHCCGLGFCIKWLA